MFRFLLYVYDLSALSYLTIYLSYSNLENHTIGKQNDSVKWMQKRMK
jgi:hypothetical protein